METKITEAFAKIQVIKDNEKEEVLVNGKMYMRWTKRDENSLRMAIVQLYEIGIGTQEEIANAFGVHVKSVYNYVNRYRIEGIEGLLDQERGPREAWKITPDMKFKILEIALNNRELTIEKMVELLERKWKKRISISKRGH